jgi:hypothetical protein
MLLRDDGGEADMCSSIVIDHLRTLAEPDANRGVAFFYCDYQDQAHQSASSILGSLTRQLIQAKSSLFTPLQDLHSTLTSKGNIRPNIGDLEVLLMSICQTYDTLYVVIDALDEFKVTERKVLFPILQSLQKASVQIFITSRQHAQDLERAFRAHPKVEIQAAQSDIQRYVEHQIDQDDDLTDLLPGDLRSKVIDTVTEKSNGM